MLELKSGSVFWTAAGAVLFWSSTANAQELQDDDPMLAHLLEIETADRIRSHILDPILGPGRSFAFVELSLEVRRKRETTEKMGSGNAHQIKETWKEWEGKDQGEPRPSGKGAPTRRSKEVDLFKGFGFGVDVDPIAPASRTGDLDPVQVSTPAGRGSTGEERTEVSSGSQRSQESTQEMGVAEKRSEASLIFKKFQVLVVHDAAVSAARLRMVRETILKAYKRDLSRDAIRFHGADFFSAR